MPGHFLQTDPVGYQADNNLYAYVGNDPLNGADTTGTCPWCAVGAIIGGAAQGYAEYRNGTLNTWQGAGRIALAAGVGAIGGGAATAIGEALVGTAPVQGGARALAGQVIANAAVGGTLSNIQTHANANLSNHELSEDEVQQGIRGGVVAGATGPVAGAAAGGVGRLATGGARGEAAVARAESQRLVQGQGAPGGSNISVGPPGPVDPAVVGAGATNAAGVAHTAITSTPRNCRRGETCS